MTAADATRLDLAGRPTDAPVVRVGFVGCGSHAFRNVYPALQFAPIELVATCDLDARRAELFARRFGAERSYSDHRAMLEDEDLDAVFVVTNYDDRGRPRYPQIGADCLRAGRHVWMEKPPAATSAEIVELESLAGDRAVMVGFKKMFAPANDKARRLMADPDFGRPTLASLQYPCLVPTVDEFRRYADGENLNPVVGFLDHLCHPVSLLLALLGMPATLSYQRATSGAAAATFGYESGVVASLLLTHGAPGDGGMERTQLVSDAGRQIVVENNTRVVYRRDPPPVPGTGYGTTPDYYAGGPGKASAVWEPEFSLGQLYNKGLFLLGYWAEINEFASAILENRPPARGTLAHARQATQIFEAFAQGPGRIIQLPE